MVKTKLSGKAFEICMENCFLYTEFGSFKYLYEISVPDDEYTDFLNWLKRCENADMSFVFAVLERYSGYKLLYGFSNFEISDKLNVKAFDFSLADNSITYNQFSLWNDESSHFIISSDFNLCIEILKG